MTVGKIIFKIIQINQLIKFYNYDIYICYNFILLILKVLIILEFYIKCNKIKNVNIVFNSLN